MSPDNKRFFGGLRRDADVKAARVTREMREAEVAMQKREAEYAIEERNRAASKERSERAKVAMAESDFPVLLEELRDLYWAADKGYFDIYNNNLPSDSSDSERRLENNGTIHTRTGYEVPYSPGLESDFILGLWKPKSKQGGTWPEKGLAMEALPDKRIILVGSGRQVLSERQWRGNPDAQGRALDHAFHHPFNIRFTKISYHTSRRDEMHSHRES